MPEVEGVERGEVLQDGGEARSADGIDGIGAAQKRGKRNNKRREEGRGRGGARSFPDNSRAMGQPQRNAASHEHTGHTGTKTTPYN